MFADACRFTPTLLRQQEQQQPAEDPAAAPRPARPGLGGAPTVRPHHVPVCRQDRSSLKPDVAEAFDAAYAALQAATRVCGWGGKSDLGDWSTARAWSGTDLPSFFRSVTAFDKLVTEARLALKPVHAKLTRAHHALKSDEFPVSGGTTGDCGHDVATKLAGEVASICVAQPAFLAMALARARQKGSEPKELLDARETGEKRRPTQPRLARFATVGGDKLVTLVWKEAVVASGAQGRPGTAGRGGTPPLAGGRAADEEGGAAGAYRRAPRVAYDTGRHMEKHPGTCEGKGEEAIGDPLLTVLASDFHGVTGEAFHETGKTDILARHDRAPVLLAECKAWGGGKRLLGTLDQALGYPASSAGRSDRPSAGNCRGWTLCVH